MGSSRTYKWVGKFIYYWVGIDTGNMGIWGVDGLWNKLRSGRITG